MQPEKLDPREEHYWVPSPHRGMKLFARRLPPDSDQRSGAVLYVHGATFPSALSIAHRFDGRSWRDALCDAGFEVWGFDFHGFGSSDRYPEMDAPADAKKLGVPSAELPAHLGLGAQTHGLVDVEAFDSIYHPGRVIVMAFWRDANSAEAWTARRPDAAQMRHRRVRIIRAYGRSDRREAPQYYPEVNRS
jgi:hypothetical protein